jgi:hypothetical protein
MDGLNLKWSGDTIAKYFTFDSFGSLLPSVQNLQMEKVRTMIDRQNKADSGYYRRISEINYRTDVEFTNNPYGNTPVIGAGQKMFGPRPMDKIKFDGRLNFSPSSDLRKRLDKRERRIEANQQDIMALHASLEPAEKDSGEYLNWLVEQDQMMTGGGFDGNAIGQVTESGLNFVVKGSKGIGYADSSLSALVVEGAKWLRSQLESWGLKPGSLQPMGASAVRMAQESDGMIGWPVYNKALGVLTQDIALRLLVCSGVDTRKFVGTTVIDVRDGSKTKFRIVDALAYILDNSTLDASDVPSIITLLARIQKHGWKMEDGKIEPKKPKTRSIYPNSALAGIIEAMTIAPFNDKLKELKVPFMPSLQDKDTRVEIIKDMIVSAFKDNYDYLAADWSKYDATVKGEILATMIYYAVRPFYNAKYYQWVDFVIYALVYKYIMMDSDLCKLNNELYQEACDSAPHTSIKGIEIFGMTGGLISGAKFTHVGGSMYGEVVIHYCIPKLIGYEPRFGSQAGDDTLMAYPQNLIFLDSVEKTYQPVSDAAEQFGLEMNVSKQIWHQVRGEVVKVFLQDIFHYNTEIWGMGSAFRPYDAVFMSERNKGLSIAEQLMAEIARMEQGWDNYLIHEVVSDWLDHEQVIGAIFKEYGESGFSVIIEAIGLSPDEIAQRIDVGSFTFGVSKSDLSSGTLHILPVIAEESAKKHYKFSAAEAVRMIGVSPEDSTAEEEVMPDDSSDLITE